MLKGKCPDCGKVYYGWALFNQKNQNYCGNKQIIVENGEEKRKIIIAKGDAFFAVDSPDVWIDGVSVCRVDMEKRIIQLTSPAKIIQSERPRGIMVIPIGKECDPGVVLKELKDRFG